MNVRVGNHIALEGGPHIIHRLQRILSKASQDCDTPWSVHVAFETLHPYMDGNGRTGRAIWAGRCKDWGAIHSHCRSCIGSTIRRWKRSVDGTHRKTKEPLSVPDGSFVSRPNQTVRKFSAEDLPFFGLATTSKETFCPSLRTCIPARSTALICTKTSPPPPSGWMKP